MFTLSCFYKISQTCVLFIVFISLRCDQTSNCVDESDEDNCKLIFMKVTGFILRHETREQVVIILQIQDNYNKKIAPFSFDKINNVNIPVNINVSMSVIDIIKIAEVSHDDFGVGCVGDSDGCVIVDNDPMTCV